MPKIIDLVSGVNTEDSYFVGLLDVGSDPPTEKGTSSPEVERTLYLENFRLSLSQSRPSQ